MAIGPPPLMPKKKAAKKKAPPKKAAAKKAPKKASCFDQCSFCGKATSEVRHLIVGPEVSICDECVGLTVEVLEEKGIRIRTGNLVATYGCVRMQDATAGMDAWPGMLLYVGAGPQRVSKLGDPMRWEALPGAGKLLIPWWVQDLTANQAHDHVRKAASQIDRPAVGTLVVQWVEHAKGLYAVSVGFAPGLFVELPEEREPIWAPKRLLPLPDERSVVINPLG